ncbi:DUF6875 domain-containing protein [Lolliginicoccus suaedae]|uniref:DUF6875 domain-containing protein n=1 Tax=Lolliginicoccus suaedae TaxID=2605429 RepID=UPI0011ED4949|nr:hypothetical protein [Lolliginicoccus suaedae]
MAKGGVMTRADRDSRSHLELGLVNLSDPGAVRDEPALVELDGWVRSFLTRPHADLGRSGPVCPFTVPSLSRKLLWAGVVRGSRLSEADVLLAVEKLVDEFENLGPSEGGQALYKAAMIVFPDLTDYSLIDRVQLARKPQAVASGLMLGQFYPGCDEPGLWNEHFRPLDCPLPMLALRHMVPSDLPFLDGDAAWTESYLKRFAPTIPAQVRATMVQRLLRPREE